MTDMKNNALIAILALSMVALQFHSTKAPAQQNTSATQDFIRPTDYPNDPEMNYNYGQLVDRSPEQQNSAQFIRSLVVEPKINFALK